MILFNLLVSTATAQQQQQQNSNQGNRLTIVFDYQLQLNRTTEDSATIDDLLNNSNEVELLEQQQTSIDDALLQDLRDQFTIPSIATTLQHPCYTESDVCGWMQTNIVVVQKNKKNSATTLERSILRHVQERLEAMNHSNFTGVTSMHTTYAYPMWNEGTGRFQLNGDLHRTMQENELEIIQRSFEQVFGEIVAAREGDTQLQQLHMLYQDLATDGDTSSLRMDFSYAGICRLCQTTDFIKMLESLFQDPMLLEAFTNRLKYDGTGSNSAYFDSVKSVTFSHRDMPKDMSASGDESTYGAASASSKQLPWFLWLAVALVVLILATGFFCIHRDQQELMKESDISTDDDDISNNSYDEEDVTTNDRSTFDFTSQGEDYTEYYTQEDGDALRSQDHMAGESTVVSYCEEMAPDGQQAATPEYEIYVFWSSAGRKWCAANISVGPLSYNIV